MAGAGTGGGGRVGGWRWTWRCYGRWTRYGWWARLWWRLSRRDGWRRPWRDDRWRLPWCGDRRRLAQHWWVRRVPQLRIAAISCTTLQSVCVCSLQSVRSSPLRLRGGALWRRGWSLWRPRVGVGNGPPGGGARFGARSALRVTRSV